jgi:ribonuclease Z
VRRIILVLVGAAVALGAIAVLALRSPGVQDRVVRRVFSTMMASQPLELFDSDSLQVLLCGTASPLPAVGREATCTAVFAGGRFWVVDVGAGSANSLAIRRVPAEHMAGILLTHLHSDHIASLGEFNLQSWVAGRSGPLPVYGGPGVERVVAGFEEAYALSRGYRVRHHGEDFLPADVGRMQARPVIAGAEPVVVLEEDGLRISAFSVDHAPIEPAYGYRFDYKGRSVVISGDTVKNAALIAAAKDADVLVHEAQANHIIGIGQEVAEANGLRAATILHDIRDYHTTPVQAAEVANEAGVELLVLNHLVPPPPNRLVERIFLRGVDDVRPSGVILGADGMWIRLPAGSDDVIVGALD